MNAGAWVVNAGADGVNAGSGGCVNDGAGGWPSVDAGAFHHHPAGCGVTGLLRRNGCSMPKPCRHVGSDMLDLLQHAPFLLLNLTFSLLQGERLHRNKAF